MKIGDTVKTECGKGKIIGIDGEYSRGTRFVVELEKNVFDYQKNEYCFFGYEMEKI